MHKILVTLLWCVSAATGSDDVDSLDFGRLSLSPLDSNSNKEASFNDLPPEVLEKIVTSPALQDQDRRTLSLANKATSRILAPQRAQRFAYKIHNESVTPGDEHYFGGKHGIHQKLVTFKQGTTEIQLIRTLHKALFLSHQDEVNCLPWMEQHDNSCLLDVLKRIYTPGRIIWPRFKLSDVSFLEHNAAKVVMGVAIKLNWNKFIDLLKEEKLITQQELNYYMAKYDTSQSYDQNMISETQQAQAFMCARLKGSPINYRAIKALRRSFNVDYSNAIICAVITIFSQELPRMLPQAIAFLMSNKITRDQVEVKFRNIPHLEQRFASWAYKYPSLQRYITPLEPLPPIEKSNKRLRVDNDSDEEMSYQDSPSVGMRPSFNSVTNNGKPFKRIKKYNH